MTEPKRQLRITLSEFTEHPGGRYKVDHRVGSKGSAEEFRDEVLTPAFLKAQEEGNTEVVVNFGTIVGVTTSYLEEVFGGLARKHPVDAVSEIIQPEAILPHHSTWVEEARRFIAGEKSRQSGEMSTEAFIYHLAGVAHRFHTYWTKNFEANPEHFPNTMLEGDWWEQFRVFEGVVDEVPLDEVPFDGSPVLAETPVKRVSATSPRKRKRKGRR